MEQTHDTLPGPPGDGTLLRLTGIRKSYGGVQALRDVDFEVRSGEVHALVGENGAGKSTLIRMISGAETPDAGTVEIGGRPLGHGGTRAAMALGIATVYQEPQLFAELTAAENVYIGRELRAHGLVDWRTQRSEALSTFRLLGIDPQVAGRRAGDLRVAQQQLVSIAKALVHKKHVLILDEPSAILTHHDIESLFRVLAAIREQGAGIIYVSHRLDEIKRIADRVTVLRDGRVVATRDVASTTIREIAEQMVGEELSASAPQRVVTPGPPLLRLAGLGYRSAFRDISAQIAAGEIVAVYGLVGSGNDELAQSLFGVLPATAGTITVDGRPFIPRTPREAQDAGIGLVPANRKLQGVFADKSVAFNLGLSSLRSLSRLSWIDRRAEMRLAKKYISRLAVKTPSPATPIAFLSGGNQQKVIIGRQLATQPRILVLQEPTQGVDVGAKAEIHRHIFSLADSGSAVLLVSTDLVEVLTLADRVLVMRGGTVVAAFGQGARSVDVLSTAAGEAGAGAPAAAEELA